MDNITHNNHYTVMFYEGSAGADGSKPPACTAVISQNEDAFLKDIAAWYYELYSNDYWESMGYDSFGGGDYWVTTDQVITMEGDSDPRRYHPGIAALPAQIMQSAKYANAKVEEIRLNDVVYTDFEYLPDEYKYGYPLQARGKRSDTGAAVYFFLGEYPVETEPGAKYIGKTKLAYTEYGEIVNYDFYDEEEGVPTYDWGFITSYEDFPLFYSGAVDNAAFSIPVWHGELKHKITIDGKKLTFWATDYFDSHNPRNPGFSRDGEPFAELVFEKAPDGEYVCELTDRDGQSTRTLRMRVSEPQDFGELTPSKAFTLYEEYLSALGDAILSANTTYAAKSAGRLYTFNRAGDDSNLYTADIDGFAVEGKLTSKDMQPNAVRNTYADILGCNSDNISLILTGVSFGTQDLNITVYPSDGSGAKIKIVDLSSGSTYVTDAGVLISYGLLPDQNPDYYEGLSQNFRDFEADLPIYKRMRDKFVTQNQTDKILEVLSLYNSDAPLTRDDIERRLYAGKDLVCDPRVVDFAAQVANYRRAQGEIPNIALMGEAGTGKSTLAKRLGLAVFNKPVRSLIPSDLQGTWMGHTKGKTATIVLKAITNNEILFIDEAYDLVNGTPYADEAISFLLPLMTRDRPEIEFDVVEPFTLKLKDDEGADKSVFFNRDSHSNDVCKIVLETGEVFKNNSIKPVGRLKGELPAIWIGGYEDEIRLLLRSNQGLYRRFKKQRLEKPGVDRLYSTFLNTLTKMRGDGAGSKLSREEYEMLVALAEKNKELIKDYFRWGSQPHYSKYFANYAGVNRFAEACRDAIVLRKDAQTGGITYEAPDILQIITGLKEEIKRQHNTVRLKGGGGALDANEQVTVVTDNKTRFSDIAGANDQFRPQVDFMRGIIKLLAKREQYEAHNAQVPKGALMEGEPGTGKTFLARAMAGELEDEFIKNARSKRVGFLSVSAPELTAKRDTAFIGTIFDCANEYDACILFIDEVDAIANHRRMNDNYSHLIELLKQMDGIEGNSNIFILAATNSPETLDPAFVRSGRIDKRLMFELPDKDTRRELAVMSLKRRLGGEFTGDAAAIENIAEDFAQNTSGLTPGDMENIINEAFIEYLGQKMGPDGNTTDFSDFADELPRLLEGHAETFLMGELIKLKPEPEFKAVKNDGRRSAVAVHETGHALARVLMGASFDKITTLGRGNALGYVLSSPELHTKADYEKAIKSAMAGRIAEEVVYGEDEISPGAMSDMLNATMLARKMVEQFGFSKKFGMMALSAERSKYLNDTVHICSEGFREQGDAEVNALLNKLYKEIYKELEDKRDLILALAKEVWEKEKMSGEEFKLLFAQSAKRK